MWDTFLANANEVSHIYQNKPIFILNLIAMPKFVIERELPGIGNASHQELHDIAQKSCSVLRSLGPEVQWVHSYVTDNKIYCVYNAPDEEAIVQHAKQGGFPVDKISRVRNIIDPVTAEEEVLV